MFFVYYLWSLLFFVVFYLKNFFELVFLKFNRHYIVYKKNIKNLSFLERWFLIFFWKEGLFVHSIANIRNRYKSISAFRLKKAPMIFFFHLYKNRTDYKINNLKFITMLYKHTNIFIKLNFLQWLLLQNIFYKKYFNLISSIFFKKYSHLNLIKLNVVFNLFILNLSKYSYKILNLNVYNDWYNYSFNKSLILKKFNFLKVSNLFIYIKNIRRRYLKKIYKIYKLQYKKVNIKFGFINFIKFKSLVKVNLNVFFKKSLKTFLPIRFSESSLNRYINYNNIKNYSFFFIRKNKIFNKSRYSRNRQLYRTGVYWCLWLNIIIVYLLYFVFYRFTFNFGYMWFGIFVLLFSTIFSRILKYNFYNIYNIFIEFKNLLVFFSILFTITINFIYTVTGFFLKRFMIIFNLNFFFINYFNLKLFEIITYFKNKKENYDFLYVWEGLVEDDKSFLRYKTILNYLENVYKVIFY